MHQDVASPEDPHYHARLLNNVQDAVVATDAALRITLWNRAAETLYGWSAREAIGKDLREVLRASFSSAEFQEHLTALGKTGHQRTEMVHYRRNGEALFVESTVIALRGADGQISGYVGVNRDVSERRRDALKLQENERRFRALIEHSSDAISLLEADGTVKYSTPAIERILGYTVEEFTGQNIFKLAHPDDIHSLREVQTLLLSTHGVTLPVLLRAQHRDGSWRWIEGFTTNLLAEPTVGAIVANYRDVTRRILAEESLRLSSGRLKVLLDMDQAILEARSPEEIARAALCRLIHLTPCRRASVVLREENTKEPFLLAVLDTKLGEKNSLPSGTRVSSSVFDEELTRSLRDGQIQIVPNISYFAETLPEMRALWNDGIRSYARVPLLANGELIGTLNFSCEAEQIAFEEYFEVWREVAGRLAVAIWQSRLHHQVHEGRRQLQALSRRLIETQEAERRHLARELHDEVGQALTAIKLSLQAAQNQRDKPVQAATLDDCIGIVEEALGRVRNLSLDLRPSLLDDLGLAAALRWYADRQAGRAGVKVSFVASGFTASKSAEDSALTPEVETACFRVAQEALTNVLRHAGAQSVEIRLRNQHQTLKLEVSDDGCGFNFAAARQKAARGSSLGLLGMEERVRLVGGHFEIDSAPGRGTRLQACFPLESASLERRATIREKSNSSESVS